LGLRRNASGVASFFGSNCAHKPVWASRNVGTPDSAETPAPVNTATLRALAIAPASDCGIVIDELPGIRCAYRCRSPVVRKCM
jgi:hypothetical protein